MTSGTARVASALRSLFPRDVATAAERIVPASTSPLWPEEHLVRTQLPGLRQPVVLLPELLPDYRSAQQHRHPAPLAKPIPELRRDAPVQLDVRPAAERNLPRSDR